MGIAILCTLAVAAVLQLPGTMATGSCPTLFNFYAHPTDCTKFYRCFWGAPHEFNCPAGTHWNQHILTCDHAYNVPCATAIIKPIFNPWIKDDGYGYVGNTGYEKGSYAGYDTNKGSYGGSYVKANDYGNYGWGAAYPRMGHNYGGFLAKAGYGVRYLNNGYGYGYLPYNNYAGYAAKAASGYARVGDPVVGRVFGKAYGTKSYGSWKK